MSTNRFTFLLLFALSCCSRSPENRFGIISKQNEISPKLSPCQGTLCFVFCCLTKGIEIVQRMNVFALCERCSLIERSLEGWKRRRYSCEAKSSSGRHFCAESKANIKARAAAEGWGGDVWENLFSSSIFSLLFRTQKQTKNNINFV